MNVYDFLTLLSTTEQPRTLTQTGGTNTINASGHSNVSGNNMIGQQTNNYNRYRPHYMYLNCFL